jgi:hypothetical protein
MLGSERYCWDEEVVVVGQVLADEATLRYEDVSNMRVSGFVDACLLACAALHECAVLRAGKPNRLGGSCKVFLLECCCFLHAF